MALTTRIKGLINGCLAPLGLKLDSLTVERLELERRLALERRGYFDDPAFPLTPSMARMDSETVFRELAVHRSRLNDLSRAETNPVGYTFDNDYFSSPDAEVLYAMVRHYEPSTIIEIGSGNSTRISRLAINDGELGTRLVCIDPDPRVAPHGLCDEFVPMPVEQIADPSHFSGLKENDILFIDSSHELRVGNDVVHLYLRILPSLPPGVVIHIHDVFLPYDYKRQFAIDDRRDYAEQYLVQALLQSEGQFAVLWAGYYLQMTRSDFHEHFPHMAQRTAQSLWLKKLG